ncbi:hypothetical protein Ciccas_010260, partial [Cichlidogyrus casuarinus]
MSSVEELGKLKILELKKLCKDQNLPDTGKKADLISRLLLSGEDEPANVSVAPEEEAALLGDDSICLDSPKSSSLAGGKHSSEFDDDSPIKKAKADSGDDNLDDSVEDDVNVVTLSEGE